MYIRIVLCTMRSHFFCFFLVFGSEFDIYPDYHSKCGPEVFIYLGIAQMVIGHVARKICRMYCRSGLFGENWL